jgi:hypothetical protein
MTALDVVVLAMDNFVTEKDSTTVVVAAANAKMLNFMVLL